MEESLTPYHAIALLAYRDDAIARRYGAKPGVHQSGRASRQRDVLYPMVSGLPGTDAFKGIRDETQLAETVRRWKKLDQARWITAKEKLWDTVRSGNVPVFTGCGGVDPTFWLTHDLDSLEAQFFRFRRSDLIPLLHEGGDGLPGGRIGEATINSLKLRRGLITEDDEAPTEARDQPAHRATSIVCSSPPRTIRAIDICNIWGTATGLGHQIMLEQFVQDFLAGAFESDGQAGTLAEEENERSASLRPTRVTVEQIMIHIGADLKAEGVSRERAATLTIEDWTRMGDRGRRILRPIAGLRLSQEPFKRWYTRCQLPTKPDLAHVFGMIECPSELKDEEGPTSLVGGAVEESQDQCPWVPEDFARQSTQVEKIVAWACWNYKIQPDIEGQFVPGRDQLLAHHQAKFGIIRGISEKTMRLVRKALTTVKQRRGGAPTHRARK